VSAKREKDRRKDPRRGTQTDRQRNREIERLRGRDRKRERDKDRERDERINSLCARRTFDLSENVAFNSLRWPQMTADDQRRVTTMTTGQEKNRWNI